MQMVNFVTSRLMEALRSLAPMTRLPPPLSSSSSQRSLRILHCVVCGGWRPNSNLRNVTRPRPIMFFFRSRVYEKRIILSCFVLTLGCRIRSCDKNCELMSNYAWKPHGHGMAILIFSSWRCAQTAQIVNVALGPCSYLFIRKVLG